MRIEVTDREAARELVRFLRRRHYLAVDRGGAIVETVPIDASDPRVDRVRTLRDVEAWAADRGGLAVRPLEDDETS